MSRSGQEKQVVARGKDNSIAPDLDINSINQARNVPRDERDKARTYLDLVGVIVLGLDLEGKIEVLNKKGCEIFGCTETPIGKSWFDFISGRCQKNAREAFRLLCTSEGACLDYEIPILDANGQERLIAWHNAVLRDDAGIIAGVISTGDDITERKKEEVAIRETKDILESLITYANAPIIVWDPKLKISRFNHAFEHLTGYRSSDVIGKPLDTLFPEGSRESSMTQIERTSKGEHWDSVEIPIRRKDGAIRTVLWNSATLHSPDTTEVLMTIAQGQDITERLNAEDALKRSEEKAKALLKYAPTGIFEIDYRILRFISVNAAMCRILGYSEEELLAIDPFEILDEDSKWRFKQRIGRLFSGERIEPTVDFGVLTKDGRKVYAMLNVTVTYNNGRPESAFVVAQDNTERKLMEDALKESEANYRGLFNGIQSPISKYRFVYDDQGEIVHWTLEDTNPAGLNLLGKISLEEVQGKNETELFGPDNREERLPLLKKLKATGERIASETYFDWSGRYYISSLVMLDKDHFINSVTDITEIKLAQLATKESEARYRSLFENNHAPMLVIDPSTGEIVDANQVASMYYGYTFEELTKMNINEINTLDPKKVKEEMAQSLNGEKRKFDFRHRLANGLIRDVEVHSGVINVQSRPLLYSIIHDVTEQKETEREVVKRTNELARSNTELQQFAYVASHDLQEPLRMVISYLSLLERRYGNKLDPEAKEYIEFAVSGGKRMKALIDDLLHYSRIDTQGRDLDNVDMGNVVEKALAILKVPIEENKAEVEIDPLPSVTADELQMVQVMQNLISNAIKFHGAEPPMIRISASPGSGEWIFSVKDNGIGFNMQYAEKIFQMFQRLHSINEYPGTGVGLAIVKKIVERHHGRIWVESEEGKGATFFFTIPLTTNPPGSKSVTKSTTGPV
jgi:PAS domain S-box-containing protein